MPDLTSDLLRYGQPAPPEPIPLRAGPLDALLDGGDLRYVRWDDREILRRVCVAVRDRNWGTVPPRLRHLRIDARPDSFDLSYDCELRQGEIDFFWRAEIAGSEDGTLTFSMDGIARSTFLKNRIGFCVLHPIRENAGRPCRITHGDGSSEEGEFPLFLSPYQPFFDIRAIRHAAGPGRFVEIRFEGDRFEMEDQRNWTDASYKTYCTPLAIPYPVEMREGERVRQSVTLEISPKDRGRSAPPEAKREETVRLVPEEEARRPLPEIGLCVASHGRDLTEKEVRRLRALHLAHLRVDLPLDDPGFEAALRRSVEEAKSLGAPLEVALSVSESAEAEFRAFRKICETIRPPIRRWLVYQRGERSTPAQWIKSARRALASLAPGAPFGGGSNSDFVDVNRIRPPAEALDFIAYAACPQVHAFDPASLAETSEAQAATVRSARAIWNKPVVVSPVTLKRRFNPDATGPEPPPPPDELPSPVDARQTSLFGAAWTLCSAKNLSESGAASVTYYETTGWRGVLEAETGAPLPDRFPSLPGAVFPLYHVLADLGEGSGGEAIPFRSSEPLRAEGLRIERDGKAICLLANLTPRTLRVRLEGLSGAFGIRRLDETGAEEAMREPEAYRARPPERSEARDGALELELAPLAYVRADRL
jgi:hypothetical protein